MNDLANCRREDARLLARVCLILAAVVFGILFSLASAQAQQAENPWAETRLHPHDIGAYRAVRGRIHLEPEYPVRLHGPNGLSPIGRGLAGVYAPLAAKAVEISRVCGSVVISGVRHTRVAGTRRMSLHASGHAVDMKGNPACIYAQLRGWPGGYSIDYGRVRHVHISLGGREDGLRFAHGGHHRRHYARRHHSRYARA